MHDFHRLSLIIATWVKELHNTTHKLICSAKREYYQKITEEVNSHNIWNIRGWTKSQSTYTSPPLKRGSGQSYTVSHNKKCNMLRESLFPEPPSLENPPPINLEPVTPVTHHLLHTHIGPVLEPITSYEYDWMSAHGGPLAGWNGSSW